jgi:hypothetical protein
MIGSKLLGLKNRPTTSVESMHIDLQKGIVLFCCARHEALPDGFCPLVKSANGHPERRSRNRPLGWPPDCGKTFKSILILWRSIATHPRMSDIQIFAIGLWDCCMCIREGISLADRRNLCHIYLQQHCNFTILQSTINTMYFNLIKHLALQQVLALAVTASPMNKPVITPTNAMIYRGPSACEDCPETVGRLLRGMYPNIHVIYAGPHEDTQINATTLKNVQVFAQGGGDGKLLDEPCSAQLR